MMVDVERILRDVGLAESMQSAEDLRLMDAVKRVIDPTGKIVGRAAAPFRTPRMLDYTVGTTLPQRAGRAGTLALVSVRCGTAPSTGDATITVTKESELSGIESYDVTVPKTDTYADMVMAEPVNASDWFSVAVTDAEGASSVSASLTITIGGT